MRTCGWVICWLFILDLSAPLLNASSRRFQNATVVSVQKYDPYIPRRRNPSDAPLASTAYDYDISIRLNCSVYVGRYESAIDYLPNAFAPNQPIEISLQKHLMFVRLPGTREIKMGVVRRYAVSGNSCKPGR
jgi:hypothetical protein